MQSLLVFAWSVALLVCLQSLASGEPYVVVDVCDLYVIPRRNIRCDQEAFRRPGGIPLRKDLIMMNVYDTRH